jgi:hypothetical protein
MDIGHCLNCGQEMEVKMCCDGIGCGCQGKPTEPPFCSENCYLEYGEDKEDGDIEIDLDFLD